MRSHIPCKEHLSEFNKIEEVDPEIIAQVGVGVEENLNLDISINTENDDTESVGSSEGLLDTADVDVSQYTEYEDSDSVGSSEGLIDTGEHLFNPSLCLQRYNFVMDLLSNYSVTSVLDAGCNNCAFLKRIQQRLSNVTLIAGVDIDRGLLESRTKLLAPLAADFLYGRTEELHIELWNGDISNRSTSKMMEGRFQAVTSIELVEHLNSETLDAFPHAVLGDIKPDVWVVTTPNREYNSLFPGWVGPYRHWDHKFEWDRKEFENWAMKVVKVFEDYNVDFSGVGFTEGCQETHGPASQIAIFRRESPSVKSTSDIELASISWEKMVCYTFPKKVDNRSRSQKIYDEAIYYARMLALDFRNEDNSDGSVLVPIIELLRFDSLKNMSSDVFEIAGILMDKGQPVDELHSGILIDLTRPDSESSDSEFSDSEYSVDKGGSENEDWDLQDSVI